MSRTVATKLCRLAPDCRVKRLMVLGVGLVSALTATPCGADDETARYFDQLRGLRLFALAEGYCLDRLSSERLAPQQRAQITLEFSRTLTEHAKFSSGDEQQQLWNRGSEVVREFLKQNPDTTLILPMRLQLALIPAARGDFLRWQSELVSGDIELSRQAEAAFKAALLELEQRGQEIYEQFRSGLRSSTTSRLPLHEVRSLWLTAKFEQALCWLGLAHLSPRDTRERGALVDRGETLLKELDIDSTSEEMRHSVRVHLAECSRLNGDYTRANSLLRKIEKGDPPQWVLDRTMAERTLILVELDRPDEAAQQLLGYRRKRGRLPGELRYLSIRALNELAQVSEQKGDAQLAAEIHAEIQTQVESAIREVGGYWGARCQTLSEFSQRALQYGTELAEILQKAESFYAQGQMTDSVQEYARAAATAQRLAKPELAAEFAYTHASILLHEQDYEAAAEAFREIGEQIPVSSRAASAYLLRSYCLGKLYEQNRTARRREAYTAALVKHREQFSGDPTAFEATWMLAQLQERRL